MNRIGIIIKKELMRVFGDRKLLFSLYIFPALIVVIICNLMGNMIGNMISDVEEHTANVTIVNGTEELKKVTEETSYTDFSKISWISEDEYLSSKDDIQNQVLEGEMDLVVYISPDFKDQVLNYDGTGMAPEMKLFYNNTEDYSAQAYSVFEGVVSNAYQNELLTERFGNIGLITAYTESPELIFKQEKANTEFISMMLPYLIVMMLFAGVMSVGVDAIAGEKERGTLSSMLITPVKRREIVIGKLVSMAILSGISAIIYSISMIFAMGSMGNVEGLSDEGFGGVSFNALQCVELLVTMLVIVYLYVGIVGFLATLAKDTKTAGSMITPMYLVVIILGVMTMFTTGKDIPTYRYLIPIYGNAMAIKDIVSNELSIINFACSLVGTFAIGVILTFAISKAFDNEKIMFNA